METVEPFNEPEFIAKAREQFSLLRWAALGSAVALPVMWVFYPPAPWQVLLTALAYGLGLWLGGMLHWRHRKLVFWIVAAVAISIGPKPAVWKTDDLPWPSDLQTGLLLLVGAGMPLVLFRGRMLRWARLAPGQVIPETEIPQRPLLTEDELRRRMEQSESDFVRNARESFSLVRMLSPIAVLFLPLPHALGAPAPWWLLLTTPVFAAVEMAALMMTWRHRTYRWVTLSLLVVVPAGMSVNSRDAIPQMFQWFCLVQVLAGLPLVLFKGTMLRWARLDEGREMRQA